MIAASVGGRTHTAGGSISSQSKPNETFIALWLCNLRPCTSVSKAMAVPQSARPASRAALEASRNADPGKP